MLILMKKITKSNGAKEGEEMMTLKGGKFIEK